MSTTEVTLTADSAAELVQLAGRSLQLPLFEGERPTGTELTLSGKIDRLTGPLHIGDKVFVLVEAEITSVDHKRGKGETVVRSHKAAIDDGFLLDPEEAAFRLHELEEEHRAAVDDAMGRMQLPGIKPDNPDDTDSDDAPEEGGEDDQ